MANKTKICTKCKKRKLVIKFYRRLTGSDKLRPQCRKCESIRAKKRYINVKEKMNTGSRNWYKNNKKQKLLKGKEWRKNNPEKYAVIDKRCRAKRRRELGFNPLNAWFDGSVAHHINKDDVIYILELVHKSVPHSLKTGKGMSIINKIAINFVCGE